MTFRPRLLTVFGLVPTLLVAGLCILRPSSFHRLELTTYDTVLRSTPLMPPGGRVIIVDVDEKSLTSAMGEGGNQPQCSNSIVTPAHLLFSTQSVSV